MLSQSLIEMEEKNATAPIRPDVMFSGPFVDSLFKR
jgi:hypothetical protein